MIFKDYYKQLNLEGVSVTQQEIKNAYRNQAKIYHPDLNKKSTDNIIKEINEAYKVLSNEKTKKEYDKLWITYVAKKRPENQNYKAPKRAKNVKEELINIFFGEKFNHKNTNPKLNQEITLNLTVSDAYFGTKKTVIFQNNQVDIEIPANTINNDVIVAKGKGQKSFDEKIPDGDLFVRAVIKDKDYEVDHLNIIRTISLSPAFCIIGGEKNLEILSQDILLVIPPHTPNGKDFVLRGKGFKKDGQKGDLILKVDWTIPENITKKEKDLYKKILEIELNKKNKEEK